MLRVHGIGISMDGRGRFSDIIFVDRLCAASNMKTSYFNAYRVGEVRCSIAAYFEFYNHERLHQALGYRAPRQVYEGALQAAKLRRGRKTAGANHELAAQ